MILLDAGPMIAILDSDDRHHQECIEVLSSVSEPLLTVWPAITEAMYILGSIQAQGLLWQLLDSDALRIASLGKNDIPRMAELMRKYSDLPMDLADAALVRVAERERVQTIFTIDRRDFEVYRPSHMKRLRIVP